MDLSKLTTSDKIVAGSGLVLFIASFLPWSGVAGFTRNGWDVGFFWAGIPALLGLAAAAVVVLKASGTELPDLPITWGQALLATGALCALLVVLKLIIGDEVCGGVAEFRGCADLDREWGVFVATIAAVGLAFGGFRKFQEESSGPSAL